MLLMLLGIINLLLAAILHVGFLFGLEWTPRLGYTVTYSLTVGIWLIVLAVLTKKSLRD